VGSSTLKMDVEAEHSPEPDTLYMQMESWSLTTVLRAADRQVCKTRRKQLEAFGPSVDKDVNRFCYGEKDMIVFGKNDGALIEEMMV
jgi:hypothetical protein